MTLSLALLCFVCEASWIAPVPLERQGQPKISRRPARPGERQFNVLLGRVEGCSNEKITIKPERNPIITWNERGPDGTKVEVYYVQDNTQPAKTYTYSDEVLTFSGCPRLANRVSPSEPLPGDHKVTQVRPGDLVYISHRTIRGELICDNLTIIRRPGGRVPDGYGDDDPDRKIKVSTKRNALQFTEETIGATWGAQLLSALKK